MCGVGGESGGGKDGSKMEMILSDSDIYDFLLVLLLILQWIGWQV